MSLHDTRGEIYRNWLIVLIVLDDKYFFYEIHSPEGYINQHLKPFDLPEAAIASAKKDIDGVIELFDELTNPDSCNSLNINSPTVAESTLEEKN